MPYSQPRYSLGSLTEGTYLSVELSNPSYTAASTPISNSLILLYRNSAAETINLGGFCAAETNQCSFQFMITHTDTYILGIT